MDSITVSSVPAVSSVPDVSAVPTVSSVHDVVRETAMSAPTIVDDIESTIDEHIAARPPGFDHWHRRLARRVLATDVIAVVAALGTAQYIRFHLVDTAMSYTVISIAFAAIWIGALETTRSREAMVLGVGLEEFRRLRTATTIPFVLFAVAGLWLKIDFARGYLAIALLSGALLVVTGRLFWRRRLAAWRRRGLAVQRVVILGGDEASLGLATNLRRDRTDAVEVVGVCIPGFVGAPDAVVQVPGTDGTVGAIPVLGDETALIAGVTAVAADVVAVTASEALGTDRLRELGWVLNDLGIRLILAPGILDVSQPRMRIAPIADISLIHIRRPRYRGASRLGKVAFDRIGALLAIVACSPLLLVLALAVVSTSHGPPIYVSQRIGAGGRPFRMYKFRSMYLAADAAKAELHQRNDGAGPLFKMRDDPRVTRVGRFIRRYSMDELPQLFNVALGQMSLVGPRPHLESEVRACSTSIQRRMLVRPGMTGLWQVSGRSDLDWDAAVRLDLKYVENWSFLLDVYILVRTLSAVVSTKGAY